MAENPNNIDMQPYVLIIEHDPELRKIMELSLEQTGAKVTGVGRFANALHILQEKPPDVFVVDFDLQDGDPGNLIDTFRECSSNHKSPVMVSTANRLEDEWRRKHKPDSVIYKPFDIRYLIRLVTLLLKNKPVPA